MIIQSIKQLTDEINGTAETIEEDYPNHRRDYVRQKAVELAVSLADHVILELSDGSVEETDLLTAEVMSTFVSKVLGASRSIARRKEMEKRFAEGK